MRGIVGGKDNVPTIGPGSGEGNQPALQGLTELDPEASITSIDGVGAFDLILAEPCWKASNE